MHSFDGQVDLSRELILVSSDASFADDRQARFGSRSYAFKLFGGFIDWETVAPCSTRADLLAILQAGKEP